MLSKKIDYAVYNPIILPWVIQRYHTYNLRLNFRPFLFVVATKLHHYNIAI